MIRRVLSWLGGCKQADEAVAVAEEPERRLVLAPEVSFQHLDQVLRQELGLVKVRQRRDSTGEPVGASWKREALQIDYRRKPGIDFRSLVIRGPGAGELYAAFVEGQVHLPCLIGHKILRALRSARTSTRRLGLLAVRHVAHEGDAAFYLPSVRALGEDDEPDVRRLARDTCKRLRVLAGERALAS